MQILRIILMVCFVFTVYPSIGEAVDMEEGSKTKSTLKATTSHPLSFNIDPNTEQIKRLLMREKIAYTIPAYT